MKRLKITALLLAGCMMLSLSACAPKAPKNDRDEDDKKTEETTEEETTTTTEETTTEETTAESSEETTTEESKDTEATAASGESKDAGSSFSGKIIDFDDMHFYVNGKKYTLGQTTLQEMIDDGVPFNEKDIKNATRTMKKNSQSLNGFGIECDKFWSPSVYVMNLSTEEKPMNECVIYKFYMHSIEKDYKNGANISFDFPYKITMDELIANAGEPKNKTDKVHDEGKNGNYTDTFRYRQKSKKYLGSREYSFYFNNGQISRITLTYIP